MSGPRFHGSWSGIGSRILLDDLPLKQQVHRDVGPARVGSMLSQGTKAYQDAVIWGESHALYAGVLAVPAADHVLNHLASFHQVHVPASMIFRSQTQSYGDPRT